MALEDRSMFNEVGSERIVARGNDTQQVRVTCNPFGETAMYKNGKGGVYGLCDAGAYFTVKNPTPGTAIIGIAAANGYDVTEGLLHVRNTSTAAQGKRLYLDYIRLSTVAVGTNGTNFALAATLDTGPTRVASGGTACTAVNTNMASSNTDDTALITFGAIVLDAATSDERDIMHSPVRSVIKVAGDQYLLDFGGEVRQNTNMATAGTAILNAVIPMPPVVLGPQDQFMLHEYASSQSVAASYEFEMGFWVR